MHTGYLASNTAESPAPSIQSTRAPVMRITPPDAPNAGGDIVFMIDLMKHLLTWKKWTDFEPLIVMLLVEQRHRHRFLKRSI